MKFDKELKMFEYMQEEMEIIMKDDSINVMVERAMVLGYHYALNVGDKDTPNKNQLQRIKTKTDILKDALNVYNGGSE